MTSLPLGWLLNLTKKKKKKQKVANKFMPPSCPLESGSKLKAIVMSYVCMAEILKEISPQYSLEGLMLKLKL